mgnify:FL=1
MDNEQKNNWENARENWARWEEQERKKDWDKWNSDSTKSSYYNQPTHPPYDQGFSIASMVCGFLSVTLGCCYLSLPLGAMGILFAILCRRRNRPLNGNCRIGLMLGIFGCIYGVFSLIYLFTHVPEQLSGAANLYQMNQIIP